MTIGKFDAYVLAAKLIEAADMAKADSNESIFIECSADDGDIVKFEVKAYDKGIPFLVINTDALKTK